MSAAIENIRKDVRARGETDSLMSNAWILVYILPFVFALVWGTIFAVTLISYLAALTPPLPPDQPIPPTLLGPLSTLIAFVYLFAIITFVLNLIIIYKLVRRRNTHFKRQIFLLEDIVTAIKAIATKKGVDLEVGLASGERTVREVKAEETEKGAMLWAILSAFIFPAVWYVWYFLTTDFYKHERREDGFWEDISRLLDKSGITFVVPRRVEPVLERSFVLYLILTIMTAGLFGIYWLYVLLKDPNHHFLYHRQIEDQLLSTLETVTV